MQYIFICTDTRMTADCPSEACVWPSAPTNGVTGTIHTREDHTEHGVTHQWFPQWCLPVSPLTCHCVIVLNER